MDNYLIMNNSLFVVFSLVSSVILNTAGQSLLKMGSGQDNIINLHLLSGLFAYGLSTIFYILILGKLNLSFIYPVVIGLTVTATTFAGVFFLKEQVSFNQWMGIGLIISGIIAVAFNKVV
jgi:multidrug transporter EmrE-like cation transporter